MGRPRLSHETRTRLLDEGVASLIGRGYHGTGIKEVLDQVKVPKGSFYNYFESKEHFGAEVIRHYAGQFLNKLDSQLVKPKADALSGMRKCFQQMIRCFEESDQACGCLVGNLGAEVGASSELCREALAEAMHGAQHRFAEAIKRAQEQGTVRADILANDLADFIWNSWEGALIGMKIENSVEPLRKFCTMVFDNFLRA
jgi:TetR/AcrR family transcriptional regulator, transcriptional repressor for nem operon